MTGFGRASGSQGALQVAVEVRSVNHRHLDLHVRLPEGWRALEPAIRELAGSRIARGRVDLAVEVRDERPGVSRAVLQAGLARQLLEQASQLEQGPDNPEITLRDLLGLPGIVRVESVSPGVGDEDEAIVLSVVREAVEELEAARRREGDVLARALGDALAELEGCLRAVRHLREPARAELLARHRARVRELLEDVEIDEARLAHEAAVLAERADLEEEIHRLDGHLGAFREALASTEPVGKRLDFLAQELHRELNTLGVKCRDLTIAGQVIEGKLACDRLREQLLNVE